MEPLWCLYVQPGSQHPAAPPLLLWRGFDNHVVLISAPLCGTCCSTILWTCIGPLWDYWHLGTSMWDWVFHHVSMGLWWVLYGGLGTPSLVGHGDGAPPCLWDLCWASVWDLVLNPVSPLDYVGLPWDHHMTLRQPVFHPYCCGLYGPPYWVPSSRLKDFLQTKARRCPLVYSTNQMIPS